MQHEKTHKSERLFKCYLCGKGFKRKSTLKDHEEIHRHDNPFECVICKRHFKQKSRLLRHEITHLEDRPFVCEVCNSRFKSSQGLVQHKIKYPNDHEPAKNRRGAYRVKRLYELPLATSLVLATNHIEECVKNNV